MIVIIIVSYTLITAGLYLPPSTLQINTVFLGLALRVLYKTKEERNRSSEEKNSRRKLAK